MFILVQFHVKYNEVKIRVKINAYLDNKKELGKRYLHLFIKNMSLCK